MDDGMFKWIRVDLPKNGNEKELITDRQCRFAVYLFFILFWLIVFPFYLRIKRTEDFTHCQRNCKAIGAALQKYADDNDGHYPKRMEMLTPDYLTAIPACRGYRERINVLIGKRPTYYSTYNVRDDFRAYTFYCLHINHELYSDKSNYPQYSSENGLTIR